MADGSEYTAEQAKYGTEREEPPGTSGWIIFASVALVVGSISHISAGMTMVFNTDWALATTDVSPDTVKILGWIHLGVAALMLISAWGVLSARRWARGVGVLFGGITVLHGIADLSVNGLFGVLGILVGAGIIFALTVKGEVVAPDQVPMGRAGEADFVPKEVGEAYTELWQEPEH